MNSMNMRKHLSTKGVITGEMLSEILNDLGGSDMTDHKTTVFRFCNDHGGEEYVKPQAWMRTEIICPTCV